MGVVVDVRGRIVAQPSRHKIHKGFKSLLFFGPVMAPESLELGLSILKEIDTEKILKPTFLQWIAFHVKEQVARVWLWQSRKSPCGVLILSQ